MKIDSAAPRADVSEKSVREADRKFARHQAAAVKQSLTTAEVQKAIGRALRSLTYPVPISIDPRGYQVRTDPEAVEFVAELLMDYRPHEPANLKETLTGSIEPAWIPWSGGECPVDPEAYVEVKWGMPPLMTSRRIARDLDWSRKIITAYRVLWSPPAEKPKRSGEVWVAIYDGMDGEPQFTIAATEHEARQWASDGGVGLACIRVQWAEGDGNMSDASQIERVARAIVMAHYRQKAVPDWVNLDDWEGEARAAIAAMQHVQIVPPDTLGMGDYADLVTGRKA